ncbi:MAG TPA: CpsB/CapC family capsule biosynthesis tyrosine phosphatase [Solirubrobacteraceae bacterium]|nr:CpsB/CapC family capsule biosynthesis tyrosine phosphatase [Solirubrobacteraceae bacterium]
MIDIHCHILGGIDDGPEDLDASVAMARAAAAAGIETVVATPHLRPDFPAVKVDEIAHRVSELRAALVDADIHLEVLPGGEVGLSWALEADDAALKRASYGQLGRDLLIETPTVGGTMLPTLLGQIAARGYRITLAHPERLSDLRENPDLVDRLLERGVRLQVNAEGLVRNPRKSETARAAQAFVRAGLVTAIASDGHRGAERRPITVLADAAPALEELAPAGSVIQLTRDGPAAILSGEPLAPVYRRESNGGVFARLRGR